VRPSTVVRLGLGGALAVALAAPALAQDSLRSPVRKRTIAEDLLLFSQVFNQIRVNHPDSLDSHELLISAIQGMVSAADPHSFVIPATRLDSAKEAALRSGRLYPVPIDFRFVDGAPLVVVVAPGSRAVSLDILAGDEAGLFQSAVKLRDRRFQLAGGDAVEESKLLHCHRFLLSLR